MHFSIYFILIFGVYYICVVAFTAAPAEEPLTPSYKIY
jgi:hypothetical protein